MDFFSTYLIKLSVTKFTTRLYYEYKRSIFKLFNNLLENFKIETKMSRKNSPPRSPNQTASTKTGIFFLSSLLSLGRARAYRSYIRVFSGYVFNFNLAHLVTKQGKFP